MARCTTCFRTMNKIWADEVWEDYLYWQTQDRKTLRRINELIRDCERDPFQGVGKPELLKHDHAGWWSRKIDEKNRFIYRVKDGRLEIAACRSHYDDK